MNHMNVVDVKAWIDARPVSRFQWNVLLLCFIIIMLDGYDAAVMGFVAPALTKMEKRGRGAKPVAAGAAALSHRSRTWRRDAQLRHAGGGIYAGAA